MMCKESTQFWRELDRKGPEANKECHVKVKYTLQCLLVSPYYDETLNEGAFFNFQLRIVYDLYRFVLKLFMEGVAVAERCRWVIRSNLVSGICKNNWVS